MSKMLLAGLVVLITCAKAQSCWRDTKCSGPSEAAFTGPWDSNNFAPSSRTVSPSKIFALDDFENVTSYPATVTVANNGSGFVYDFGKEVGGIVTVRYSTAGSSGRLGLAFTESSMYIGIESDSSNGAYSRGVGDYSCNDGALYDNFTTEGDHSYTMELRHLRGGFRYLTLFLLKDDSASTTRLTINDVSLEIGFQPTWSNLRAYQGYFHSNDEMLNKIWYSGAYTLQTNSVPVDTGRFMIDGRGLNSSWANNGTLSNGTTVIVDGAKRDRAVWPGDMGIAVPSSFYSLGNDLDSVKNALQTMIDHQNKDGSYPEAGPPLLQQDSDTYHCWTMIGSYNYVLYTNDTAWLEHNWVSYERAMDYVYGKVLYPLGLLNVTGTRDWARQATSGNSSEPNMILYKTLRTGADLASWLGKSDLSKKWNARAETLKTKIFAHLFDGGYQMFKDNTSDTLLFPQDANSMALLWGIVEANSTAASSISNRLTTRWNKIGAEAPELPHNISPFISSFEIQGHFEIGETARALDLIRRSWGWYLNSPNGTQSTVIEGYLTNGSFGYRNYRGYAYDSSYVSHSHGWSSGPTSALTNYVLGLSVTGRVGSTWQLKPQFGGLKSVEGGFVTKLGKFWAGWNVTSDGKGYHLAWSVPKGTEGVVAMPTLPGGGVVGNGRMIVDGEEKGHVEVGGQVNIRGGRGSVLIMAN